MAAKMRTRQNWRDASPEERRETPKRNKKGQAIYLKPPTGYPVMLWNERQKDYVYSKFLLRSAISLANLHGDSATSRRAQRILDKEFGE